MCGIDLDFDGGLDLAVTYLYMKLVNGESAEDDEDESCKGGIVMTERTKQNINYTLSTFAVEGLKPSKEAVKLYEKMDDGKLSLADTLKAIERNHGVAGDKRA